VGLVARGPSLTERRTKDTTLGKDSSLTKDATLSKDPSLTKEAAISRAKEQHELA